ncbi:hypothetical protein [Paenibacillus tengchongensis]|uniref:hypothetical protein n=1 Tax=Paenibacillus tengchongensis TaxID=2608684 RepID=UPI00124CF56E|nr:hypothetical protein [Paenibacillus tengchongensis]
MPDRNKRRAVVIILLAVSLGFNVTYFMRNRSLQENLNLLSSRMRAEIQGEASLQQSSGELIQKVALLELEYNSQDGRISGEQLSELRKGVMSLPHVTKRLGFITKLAEDDQGIYLELDEVEWLSGAEAVAAAKAAGLVVDGDELPNNFYIRNDSGESVRVPLDRDVQIAVLDGAVHKLIPYDELISSEPLERLFHVTSAGDKGVLLEEQYRP